MLKRALVRFGKRTVSTSAHELHGCNAAALMLAGILGILAPAAPGQVSGELQVRPVEGNFAFNELSTKTAQRIGVTVTDASGSPVQNALVVFQTPDHGPSLHFGDDQKADREVTAHADSGGVATTPYSQPDGGEGIFQVSVLASAGGKTGHATLVQSNVANLPAIAGRGLSVTVKSGAGAVNKIKRGSSAPGERVSVQVTMAGRPVQGAKVIFSFPHIPAENGGADLDGEGTVTTGADGMATIPPFHAKPPAGTYRISVVAMFNDQTVTTDVRQSNILGN